MTANTLPALLLFAFTSSITPGPNNTMLFASGVNFGFRRTLPHMVGVAIGFFVLLECVGFGLGAILSAVPMLFVVMKFVGALYLLWIAYKLATTTQLGEINGEARPMSFFGAAAFQWVNPKAWMMAVPAMTTFTNTEHFAESVLFVGVVFAMVNLPSIAIWVGFGSTLRDFLSDPRRLIVFNRAMALLLLVSLYPMIR